MLQKLKMYVICDQKWCDFAKIFGVFDKNN